MLSFCHVISFCGVLFLSLSVSGQLIDRDKFMETIKKTQSSSLSKESREFLDIILQEMILMLQDTTNTTGQCVDDFVSLGKLRQVERLTAGKTLNVSRLEMAIDSFGKPGPGFLRGNTKFTGSFDECLSIDTASLKFKMQYCELTLAVVELVNGKMAPGASPLSFTEGLCLPTTCTFNEINETFWKIDFEIAMLIHSLSVPDIWVVPTYMTCTPQGGPQYTAGAVIMIVVCFIFVILTFSATIVDIVMSWRPFFSGLRRSSSYGIINAEFEKGDLTLNETDPLLGNKKRNRFMVFLSEAVMGFSLYKTVPAVLSTKQPPTAITSINGLRVISMFWVILCHTYFFLFAFQNLKNFLDLIGFVARFSSQPILNGFFSVDSFFFLSGLLVAYLTFRMMQRNKGRFPFIPFYVHRILRLTPTYMFVLFFYWFLTVHLGTGPILKLTVGPGSVSDKNCRDYWWTNLFYINNFYPVLFNDECMGWTWYLANDMQFYVISPLILIPLYYWLPGGLMAVGTLLVASVGITGYLAGHYEYTASIFYPMYAGSDQPPNVPDESTEIYGKPYCRITPYLVGIVLGYMLFKKYRIPSLFSRNHVKSVLEGWAIHILLWVVAFILGMVNVYGLYWSWHGHELSAFENVTYFMFSRFTWGVTLALVVFVCHNGYGGVINRFLSMPMWIPLSRLTFNAYLVHEMMMLLLFGELREPLYFSDTTMVMYIIAMVVLSFGAAFAISIFVEFPLSNLESAVFKLCGAPLRSSTRRNEDSLRDGSPSALERTIKIS